MATVTLPDWHPFRSADARDRYLDYYDARAGMWPVVSDTMTVETNQGRTFVRVSGPVDGPALVLLPGMWSDSLMWPATMIQHLAATFRTYAVDNIYDFGRSVNARSTTSILECVTWLDELFNAIGLDDGINLVGCSLGAWFFAEYALHAPERVGRMAWMSPGGVVLSPVSLGTLPGLPLMAACLVAPSRFTVGALMRMLMHDAARSDGSARTELEQYIEDVALGLRTFTRRPLARGTNRRFSDTELGSLRMPVLYVAGEHEKFCPPRATAARLAAVAPRIETTVFRNAGHDLIMLQPQALTERVLQFLEE